MVRASPCDYYLRFLVSHPDGYTDFQIRNLVKLQHLDFLGMGHLGRIRVETLPPTPFYPEDELHEESQRFLMKHRIYSLYFYEKDEDMKQAIRLLDHPRGKEMTEQMLFSGAEPLWVSHTLKRLRFTATPRTIELYKHFYFNTDLVSETEMRAIMGMRSDLEVSSSDNDELNFKAAYKLASKSHIADLTTNAAISPFSRILGMLKVGLMPNGVQISRLVTAGRAAATVRSLENTLIGRPEAARDFALTAKLMNELLESVGDASGDLQNSLMKLALDTDASEIPSIQSLSGGNHTTDLVPELIKQEVPENVSESGE